MNADLPQLLAARLARPLPGPMVGSRFEPRPTLGRRYDQIPPHARRAAVLLLLYPHQGDWHLPLTLRPPGLSSHAGQIALPGGRIDPGESSRLAALRELHEELGAMDQPIELLGRLSPLYVSASNFQVEPWIGVAPRRPRLEPNAAEVEALLEVSLEHLMNPSNLGDHQRLYQGDSYRAPHFAWKSHLIWGATCMILGEFITLLEELDTIA